MMGSDSIKVVRGQIGERIAELQSRVPALSPADICARMDAIRTLAIEHGLTALEGVAHYGARHALMPGHATATRACLAHMEEALDSEDAAHDRESILAALALRLH